MIHGLTVFFLKANILVTDDLHCCLADFGLAKAVMTRGPESYSDSPSGTARWLAPELLQIDASSDWRYMPSRDIYAFGCTVVEVCPPDKYRACRA